MREARPKWATIVYPPNEEVKFISITEEKNKYSAMVNPINEEYQEYILNIFREIVEKYPELDGIILDRVRYDGFTADFFRPVTQKNLKPTSVKNWICFLTTSIAGRRMSRATSIPKEENTFYNGLSGEPPSFTTSWQRPRRWSKR